MKFRKAMNVSFVLVPILVFTIGIPVFRFIYTAKDVNNMKKVLQEAAYSGALAGTYAIDIVNFENGTEFERPSTTVDNYPLDNESKSPASFMLQKSRTIRFNQDVKNSNDCLSGANGTPYPGVAGDIASKEIVETVKEYINNNLNMVASGSKAVYSENDYGVAIKFERHGLITKSGSVIADDNMAPYNKVTVSVTLKYKPTMLKGMTLLFGKNIADEVVIYGTSSAKTQTII